MGNSDFAWGGAVGDLGKDWLYKTIGKIGAFAAIIIAFLAYVIWRFNPSFGVKKQVPLPATEQEATLIIETEVAPANKPKEPKNKEIKPVIEKQEEDDFEFVLTEK